jgi:hypothetical protein
MLSYPKISQAQIPPSLQPDFSCLNNDMQVRIVTCFEENSACHIALTQASQPPSDYKYYLIGGSVGIALGIILDILIRH